MREDLTFDGAVLAMGRPAGHASPGLVLVAAAFTAAMSTAVCAAAIVAHAPVAVVPLVVALCIGGPIFAGWNVPVAVASMRANRGSRALARLRRSLEQLPETEHPLGL